MKYEESGIIDCNGRCDHLGAIDPNGSFISFTVILAGARHRVTLSERYCWAFYRDIGAALEPKPKDRPLFYGRDFDDI